MKKSFSILAACIAASLLLAGCMKSQAETETAAPQQTEQQTETLRNRIYNCLSLILKGAVARQPLLL